MTVYAKPVNPTVFVHPCLTEAFDAGYFVDRPDFGRKKQAEVNELACVRSTKFGKGEGFKPKLSAA